MNMLSSFPWVWQLQITFAIFLSFLERILMLHTQIAIHILQNQCSRHIVWILVPEMSLVFPISPLSFWPLNIYTLAIPSFLSDTVFSLWALEEWEGCLWERQLGKTTESQRRISTLLLIPWLCQKQHPFNLSMISLGMMKLKLLFFE